MKVILEIDHTVSKEEITNWIEEVLKPNTPCIWGYSFEEYHCGSCHNSQLEKENAELKTKYESYLRSHTITCGMTEEEIIEMRKENAELKAQNEKLKSDYEQLLDEKIKVEDRLAESRECY